MKTFKIIALSATALAGLALAPASQAATCIGNCGTSTSADGVVTLAPNGRSSFDWVSTRGGVQGAAQIPGFLGTGGGGGGGNGGGGDGPLTASAFASFSVEGGGPGSVTNGSELVSDAFFATAGQNVSFWFNYVTSDGSGFADYSFAQLLNASDGSVAANLFTARTKPSGVIVPGTDLPAVEATLNPSAVEIQTGTDWSALGSDSGRCYAAGCGNTGWVSSTYAISTSGSYQLRFGSANWNDSAYDSGLAFSGLLLDGSVIGDGSSFENPLLPGEVGSNGEFIFAFTATPGQTVWIDPIVATGYDYVLGGGSPNILSAIFPELGDADGYQIFSLSDLSTPLFTNVMGNQLISFGPSGIAGFALRGINASLGLNPTNTTAFVTGLSFNVTGTTNISITQTPVTSLISGAVPEPASWALMIAGFGLVGSVMRRRRPSVLVSFA
jgi:PEP-CTERM motif